MPNTLKINNISYSTKNKNLLSSISLSFTTGALYGILGPNGSGKSTLLKNIAGIWTPTSGTVLWHDENLHKKPRKEISQIISLVPQNPEVHFAFTVEELVKMGRYPKGGYTRGEESAIHHCLELVDGAHLTHRPLHEISFGERQRVYIARALAAESPVMLLDEPTSGLDIRHQLEIWNLLRYLVSLGKIIIVTIHDLPAAERFCDQIALLDGGRCVKSGCPSAVLNEDTLQEVFHVTRNQNEISLLKRG